MRHCSAVDKELLARAGKPGSTPGEAVSCFFVPFFLVLFGLFFFNIIFPFGLFFSILTADPAGHTLGSIYILSVIPEFCFAKGIFDEKKNHKLSRHVPPLKQLNFFQC